MLGPKATKDLEFSLKLLLVSHVCVWTVHNTHLRTCLANAHGTEQPFSASLQPQKKKKKKCKCEILQNTQFRCTWTGLQSLVPNCFLVGWEENELLFMLGNLKNYSGSSSFTQLAGGGSGGSVSWVWADWFPRGLHTVLVSTTHFCLFLSSLWLSYPEGQGAKSEAVPVPLGPRVFGEPGAPWREADCSLYRWWVSVCVDGTGLRATILTKNCPA